MGDFEFLTESKNIDHAQTLLREGRIQQTRDFVTERFTDFYSSKGYQPVAPLPLISEKDKSVLFIGASISAIKDILISGEYPDGYQGVYLSQNCLRTTASHHAFENEWIPYGQMYFEMITILSKPGRFREVFQEAIQFFCQDFGISPARIKIRTTAGKDQLKDVDDQTGLEVEYDAKPPKYYHWEYGIEGVHGEGLTIAIKNTYNDSWLDIGNIVIIYNEKGEEMGVEFGFGYEFFLTSVLGVDQALKLSRVFEFFPFEAGLSQKYYSELEALVAMRHAGAHLGRGDVHFIYGIYLRSLNHIGRTLKKSTDEIIGELESYSRHLSGESIDFSRERRMIELHEARKQHFRGILNKMRKSSDSGTLYTIYPDPEQFIYDHLIKNGINIREVEWMFRRLSGTSIRENLKARFKI